MNKLKEISFPKYNLLLSSIGNILEKGRKHAYVSVNSILVTTYWEIGKKIVEFEQKGASKADYGLQLLETLSHDLKKKFGKGFSRSNIYLMRAFYSRYPKIQTVSGKFTWSHLAELVKIDDKMERQFYENQTLFEKWSVRELKRQINSALFHRIALSKNAKGIVELSKKGSIIQKHSDMIRDPYVFEFLNIPFQKKYSEKELEEKIIDNIQSFLLELGKGFAFINRQYRITLDNTHYFVDLVFYHIVLKCFVLIDLKIGKANHIDIGQMNMYLNYFKREENSVNDNEPVGIILASNKDNIIVEYALGGISNKVFVSKYQLYLPDKKMLEEKLKSILNP